MNLKICGFLLIALLPMAACAGGARSNAHKASNTVMLEDWENWATQVGTNVTSAAFFCCGGYPTPCPIAIGDFINSSRRMDVGEDKDIFLNALSRTLTNSGRVTVSRVIAGTGGRKDSVTQSSHELTEDPMFRKESTDGLYGQANAPKLVLSCQFSQKKTILDNGDTLLENYCHIDLIDQTLKTSVYSDDVRLQKKSS